MSSQQPSSRPCFATETGAQAKNPGGQKDWYEEIVFYSQELNRDQLVPA